MINKTLGVTLTIVANALTIYSLHELGKKRRVLPNLASSARLFTTGQSSAINNTYKNITNGGAAVGDEIGRTVGYLQRR